MARISSPNPSVITLRSPVPLLAGGIAAAVILIALATLVAQRAPDLSKREILNEQETIVLVAREMRSGEAALRVAKEGRAHFVEDEGWIVTVGDARFLFNDRKRILIPQNDAARELEFSDASGKPAPNSAPGTAG